MWAAKQVTNAQCTMRMENLNKATTTKKQKNKLQLVFIKNSLSLC